MGSFLVICTNFLSSAAMSSLNDPWVSFNSISLPWDGSTWPSG